MNFLIVVSDLSSLPPGLQAVLGTAQSTCTIVINDGTTNHSFACTTTSVLRTETGGSNPVSVQSNIFGNAQ